MASTEEDVSRHNKPKAYVQKTTVSYGLISLTLAFTDIRGDTLIGKEGDHTTANAAYLDFAILTSQRHIEKAKAGDFTTGVTGFMGDIKARAQQDDYFLKKFALTEKNSRTFEAVFDACSNDIDILQDEYEEKVNKIHADLSAKQNVKRISNNLNELLDSTSFKQPKEGLAKNIEELVAQAENLDTKLSENMIAELQEEYFFRVAEIIMNTYLSSQSWQNFVTFERHSKARASDSEGSDVRIALQYLKQFSNPHASVEAKNIDKVASNIGALLHYPPLPDNVIKDCGSTNKKNRTNDIRILQFVLARHLSLMFAAYPALQSNEVIKDKIIEAFLNEKLETWMDNDGRKQNAKYSIDVKEQAQIKKAIKEALIEADNKVIENKRNARPMSLSGPGRANSSSRSSIPPIQDTQQISSSSSEKVNNDDKVADHSQKFKNTSNSTSSASSLEANSKGVTQHVRTPSLTERVNKITHEYKQPSGDILRGREVGAPWYSQAMTRIFGPVRSKNSAAQNVSSMEGNTNEKKHERDEPPSDSGKEKKKKR